MKEIQGNLWDYYGKAVIAITTGGAVSRRGEASMRRGCARQARERFPQVAAVLGELIRTRGNHVHELGGGLVSFPVEESPFENPDPALIERSARELAALADARGWSRVIVPRPGCGTGGLAWRDVRPLLVKHLDERFEIISPSP